MALAASTDTLLSGIVVLKVILATYIVIHLTARFRETRAKDTPPAPPPLPGLEEKLAQMGSVEQELAQSRFKFLFRTWQMALWAHFGPIWLLFGFISLIGWYAAFLRSVDAPGQGWVALALIAALLIPFAMLATSRRLRRDENKKDPLRDLLAKVHLDDIPWSSFGILAAGVIITAIISRFVPSQAGKTLIVDEPAWYCFILLAFALRASGLFPSYEAITDRVFEITPLRSPRLYQLIREVADKAEMPMPRRVFLAHGSSMAHIDTYLSQRDLIKGRITELRIGLRHLLMLGQDELRTLVLHELRHQSHRSALRSVLWKIIPDLRRRGQDRSRRGLLDVADALEVRLYCLMRANENDCDRASAGLDGPATARCLARLHAYGVAYSEFWNDLDPFILRNPTMPGGPRQIEIAWTREPGFTERLNRAYAEALLYTTLPGDTHPELTDRLNSIGQPAPPNPGDPAGAPSEELLDEEARAFLQRLELEWMSANRDAWREKWATLSAWAKLLDTPVENYAGMQTEELRNLGNHLWTLRSPAAARPAMEALHAAKPKDDNAGYWVRRARVECGEPGAEDDLLAFARANLRYRSGIAKVAIRRKLSGRDAEASMLWKEFIAAAFILEKDREERNTLKDSDPVRPHELEKEDLEKLRGVCLDYGVIRQAHVCRRELRHVPTPAEHIIVVNFWQGSDGRYKSDYEKHQASAIEALKAAWGGSEGSLWVISDERLKSLSQRVKALPDAHLHG